MENEMSEDGWTAMQQRHYEAGIAALARRCDRSSTRETAPRWERRDGETYLAIYGDGSVLDINGGRTLLYADWGDWIDWHITERVLPAFWGQLPDAIREYLPQWLVDEVLADEAEGR